MNEQEFLRQVSKLLTRLTGCSDPATQVNVYTKDKSFHVLKDDVHVYWDGEVKE